MAEENIVKPEPDTGSPLTTRKAELVRPKDGMAYFYSNHFQLGQTASDVRIVFGEITNVIEQTVEVTQRAQVTLAWLQAKVLAEFLTAHVRLFEERNGPIQTDFAPLINATPPTFPRVVEPKA
jgi:Protein of unknown function (DUF3467)